jgi:hypothetical protein
MADQEVVCAGARKGVALAWDITVTRESGRSFAGRILEVRGMKEASG